MSCELSEKESPDSNIIKDNDKVLEQKRPSKRDFNYSLADE